MTNLFRRILVPHDFSVQAMEALEVAVGLAAEHGGRVRVLHVVTPLPAVPDLTWSSGKDLRAALQKRLQAEVDAAMPKGAGRAVCDVVVAEPVPAILAAARKADSIVMATLGRTGLAHWLLGSVAEKIVRLSPVPVLTVRAKGKTKRGPRGGRRSSR